MDRAGGPDSKRVPTSCEREGSRGVGRSGLRPARCSGGQARRWNGPPWGRGWVSPSMITSERLADLPLSRNQRSSAPTSSRVVRRGWPASMVTRRRPSQPRRGTSTWPGKAATTHTGCGGAGPSPRSGEVFASGQVELVALSWNRGSPSHSLVKRSIPSSRRSADRRACGGRSPRRYGRDRWRSRRARPRGPHDHPRASRGRLLAGDLARSAPRQGVSMVPSRTRSMGGNCGEPLGDSAWLTGDLRTDSLLRCSLVPN
jgi:hypothetical protein